MLLPLPQLERNLFFVLVTEKQQNDMAKAFGHFQWSLKRKNPDYNINCYVINLYQANWLTEVAYLFGLLFFVKKKENLGCFCNSQNDFDVRQQHQTS